MYKRQTLRNENGQILASSREVADRFSKNHKEVLRSIKNISKEISTAQFCALFKPSTYKASNGKSNPEYLLTRDGFSPVSYTHLSNKIIQKELLSEKIEKYKRNNIPFNKKVELRNFRENELNDTNVISVFDSCLLYTSG